LGYNSGITAMQIIIILLLIVILALAGLSCFLFFYYARINKGINVFLEKGNIKDAREVLFDQLSKTKEIELNLQELFNRIGALESASRLTIQKIGVIRFNPFDAMGGNQSFSIAMLDSQNNGFVISSLFTQDGNRVYAKPIINSASEHILSKEEKEAIARAIK